MAEKVKTAYSWFKKVGLQLFGGLLMEEKVGKLWTISLGRVAFWSVFTHCMYVWNNPQITTVDSVQVTQYLDVTNGELYTLWALLGYAIGKAGLNAVKSSIETVKGASNGTDQT